MPATTLCRMNLTLDQCAKSIFELGEDLKTDLLIVSLGMVLGC